MIQRGISRRRLLHLTAAGAGFAIAGNAIPAQASALWRWRGSALGAEAEILLAHPDQALAIRATQAAVAEIARLEAIFSLYRPDSALVRLNRDGRLDAPPPELVATLSMARRFAELSAGAFDVTVQPLWRMYADHFAAPNADPDGPPREAVAAALALVDYRAMSVTTTEIAFARAGMAVTLNGIAQGIVTDRVVDLLHDFDFDRVLADIGEVRAGAAPDGQSGWTVELASDTPETGEPLSLAHRAVATSAPGGLRFGNGGPGHLLDPRTGQGAGRLRQVSVVAARAATADALSTALCVCNDDVAVDMIAAIRPDRVIRVGRDGIVTDSLGAAG